MKKLVILSLIVTVFGSAQTIANAKSDNILPVENPICNMNLPFKMSVEFISEYRGLHELVNQSNDEFSYSDLRYMCQYIYILKLNPDAPDEDGNTPLHIAATNINYTAVSILLEAGADPTLSNNDGLTPFDVAREATIMPLHTTRIYNKIHDITSRAERNKNLIIDALETAIEEDGS